MAKIALAKCVHKKLSVVTYSVQPPAQRGLCTSCFGRVVSVDHGKIWVDDYPIGGGTCIHKSKNQLPANALTKNKPYRNAICNHCGAGLRSPNDSDEWRPLREYRFVIEEFP